jgi:hypothetical protein
MDSGSEIYPNYQNDYELYEYFKGVCTQNT